MTASHAVIKLHRRNSGWLKPALIVLCLTLAGFGAITLAEVTGARTHTAEVPLTQRVATKLAEAPASATTAVLETNDKSGVATSAPRECRPYEGDVSECIFN